MMNPIVGQCVLYVVQKVYAAQVMICKKSTDWEGAMHVFGWIIVGLYYCTMYYICAFYVCQE